MNRHKKYKDSGIPWIGEIPKDWEVVRLKTIFYEYNKKSLFGSEELLSLSQYTGIRLKSDTSIAKSYEAENYEGYRIVKSGQFVMNIMLAWNGSYALSEYDGMISPAYCVYDFRIDCHRKYYHYLLKIEGYQIAFKTMSRGIIDSRLRLYPEQFYTFSTLTPPISNQRAIADFLDVKCAEVDELIALQGKMIDELKVYKQSVITEAVTKGLNPDAPLKDSGIEWIGHIPKHWKIVPFKTTYRLTKGLTITKADLVENGVPVISYGQIHSKLNTGTNISDSLIRYVPESLVTDNNNSLVCKGDIIFADTSEDLEGCGNCVYIDRKMVLFAGYHTIIAKNTFGLSSRYIAYLFKTDCWRYQLRTSVNGVKLFSISQKILANTSVILPSEIEQQQIADYLDTKCAEIDEMTNIKQQKIEQLKEYKKSIIYEYVTGKKQVNIE